MSLRRYPNFKELQYLFTAGGFICINFAVFLQFNHPFVHCSDTVSRSGMFCAIATTIDGCKTEGVVDVFQVVKALRIHKPGAVLNVVNKQAKVSGAIVYITICV